jgi:hypothetical protein
MMKFEVRTYRDEYAKRWRSLLDRARNATLFHDLKFLSYHPEGKYETNHLVFFEGDRTVSGLPAAVVSVNGRRVLRSPYGASWGGLIIPAKLGTEDVHELVEAMIHFSREAGIDRIELTLPPSVYIEGMDQVQEYCLLSSGFRLLKGELTEIIGLSDFDETALSSSYRRGVKKASRTGVTVGRSMDFDLFHDILIADRASKHVEPTHSREDLSILSDLFPEKIVLFTARVDDRIVGGVLLFVAGRKTVLNMYLCQLPEVRSSRVANLLMYESADWARKDGFDYLDLGTSSIDMVPNWGLTRFKEGFLGRGFIRPTFVYDTRTDGNQEHAVSHAYR